MVVRDCQNNCRCKLSGLTDPFCALNVVSSSWLQYVLRNQQCHHRGYFRHYFHCCDLMICWCPYWIPNESSPKLLGNEQDFQIVKGHLCFSLIVLLFLPFFKSISPSISAFSNFCIRFRNFLTIFRRW